MTGLKTIINGLKHWTVQQLSKLPQPNLDQNDPTAPDYVKGRKFWSELGEKTYEYKTNEEVVLENFPLFNVGDTVKVTVDGTEHSLVAFDNDGVPAVGDSFDKLSTGRGDYGWLIYVCKNLPFFWCSEERTITYNCMIETVHKIDDKYLSDNVYTKNGGDIKILPKFFPYNYSAEKFDELWLNYRTTVLIFTHNGITYTSGSGGCGDQDQDEHDKDFVAFSGVNFSKSAYANTIITDSYIFYRDGTYEYCCAPYLGDKFLMCDQNYTKDENGNLVMYAVSVDKNGVLTVTRQ